MAPAPLTWFERRRFACVRQSGQSDCGPAALATVALQHGLGVRLEALREAAGTDRVGTSLAGILRAAEALGFAARAVKGDPAALAAAPVPAILHVKSAEGGPHFVVLHRVDPAGVVLADPARGVERLSLESLLARWSGYAVLLAPTRLPTRRLAEVTPPWRRLLTLVAGYRGELAWCYVCALLMMAVGVTASFLTQHTIDGAIARGDLGLLHALGVGVAALTGFRVLFGASRQYLMAWLGRQLGLSLVSTYARHVLRLPVRFFETRRAGEVLSRLQDAAKVRDAISGAAMAVVVDATTVIAAFGALWLGDRTSALVATAFVPVLLIGIAVHHLPAQHVAREAVERGARLASHLIEDVAGVEAIKSLGLEPQRSERADDLLAATARSTFSLQRLHVSMQGVSALAVGGANVAVLWHGGRRVIAGELTLGQLLFAQAMLSYLLQPFERLASVVMQMHDALVAVDRLYQILEVEPERRGTAPVSALRSGIELRRVSFRYNDRCPTLRGVDLWIPRGAVVAIVGESGSGKSTLLRLIQRFHDPTEGRVLVDGVDLRDLDLTAWRAAVGVVPQEATVFSGTLRENVLAGAVDAGPDAADEAARAAGLDEVIARLPERWDTVLGERGASLSGGQRQRVAIARALARRPQLLLFDEATSHLDTSTELAIQRGLAGTLGGTTMVVVAHRLSTVRNADLIAVMHDGQIAERGTHGELLALGGRYAKLWRAQAGLDNGGAFRGQCPPDAAPELESTQVDAPRALRGRR